MCEQILAGEVYFAILSPDGGVVFGIPASADGRVRVWNTGTGWEQTLSVHGIKLYPTGFQS